MSTTFGDQIKNSSRVKTLIEQVVEEIGNTNKNLKNLSSSDEGLTSKYKVLLDEVAKTRGRPLFYPYIGSGAGRGVFVELEDGSVKIDLINGIGIHILGHSHPRILRACLEGALSDVVVQGNLQPNREYLEFSKKILNHVARVSRLKHSWITTCGTMANENALKMVRQKKTPARKVIAMRDAFAGRSTLMAEITDNPSFREGLPEYGEVLRVPFYDRANPKSSEISLNILKEHFSREASNICAFMFEPIQGEGGFRVPTREFLLPLLRFCRDQKIPVWADEVQTFCRTGELFAFETLGIGEYIDICTIAKTAQVGATLYTEEYNPKPGLISGTFAGTSVALAAGCEVLDILCSEGYLGPNGRVSEIYRVFVAMLDRLAKGSCRGAISDVDGMGLMIAFTPFGGTKEQALDLCKELFAKGVIAFNCGHGPHRIRFLIPATITNQEIDLVGNVLEKSIVSLKEAKKY